MTKRKTLGNILKPEEQEFVDDKESPVAAATVLRSPDEPASPMLSTDELLRILPAVPNNALSPLNVRINPLLVIGLKNASRIREFQQQAPWTQRDIVSEALEEWMISRGFMKGSIARRN